MTRRRDTPAPETRRCAVYCRKSTAHGLEKDFNSLDAQREACERYIQAQPGWVALPELYNDGGYSGSTTDRPAFQRLLADVEAGEVDIVVVYKVDRLSRSLLDFAGLMDRFNQTGTSFVSITQNFSTADAMGRLTLNLLMSFAEFEREMTAERTKDKVAAARRKGKWTGGSVPLGYEIRDGRLVVNDLEAVTVREVFTIYLERGSALETMRELNARGRCTKRHQAKNGNLREGKPWDRSAVLRLLRNPVLAGYASLGAELHEGEHQGIVDRETFARAQALLDQHAGDQRHGGLNPAYILRGLLRCGVCGSAMTPASTRGKGKEYRYYRCSKRDKQGPEACPARPLPAAAIEEFVVDKIRGVAAAPDIVQDVTARLHLRLRERRESLRTERRGLPGAIATLSTEASRLASAVVTASGTARRVLVRCLEAVGQQIDDHERRLSEVELAMAALDQVEIESQWVTETLSRFDTVWDVLTPENRARLVRALVRRVEVDEAGSQVTVELVDLGLAGDTHDRTCEATS